MASVLDAPLTAQLRAAIYARVSTLEQGQHGFSLGAQVRDGEALAAELRAVVVAVFEDQDSGAAWDLPGLNRLLDAAKRREFDLLIVYDPDRLARNMAKQLVIEEELKRYGVTIRYVTLRLGDSAEDRLLKNVRASIAEYEREKIKMRTQRGRREKAERGLVVGAGKPPFGLEYVRVTEPHTQKLRVVSLQPDPLTAPIVLRIFHEAAEVSANEVARRLTADATPTYLGGHVWSGSTVRTILQNPVYLGTAPYGRRDGEGHWRDSSTWIMVEVPALVTQAEWDAAHRGLRSRKLRRRRRRGQADDPYILRELLVCQHCGGGLACEASGLYRYYYCMRHKPGRARDLGKACCPLPPVPAVVLEEHTWAMIGVALLDPARLTEGMAASRQRFEEAASRRREQCRTLEQEIKRRRAELRELVLDRARSRRGSETWRILDDAVRDSETNIERLLADRVRLEPQGLPGLSVEQAEALEQFAAEVRLGLGGATPVERRKVSRLLQLTGRVRYSPDDGLRLGRHRFVIDWDGVIEFPCNDGNLVLFFFPKANTPG
jgi:site-specific DNA recombinase